ncbi:MAG: hypothetical protein ACLP1X_23480 [Polyangiaceae bacterium]
MRPVSFGPAALLLFACSSSSQATSVTDASMSTPAEDASTAPCTSLGGTCGPYTTTCPLPQQNTTLCGDTVLLCCLPIGTGEPVATPEGGGQAGDDAGADSGGGTAPTDASSSYPPNG